MGERYEVDKYFIRRWWQICGEVLHRREVEIRVLRGAGYEFQREVGGRSLRRWLS